MIDVILPELPERELALASEETPHDPGETGPPLTGRVLIGGPLSVPVTTELAGGDPELTEFLAAEADAAAYHLVHLSLNCGDSAGQPPLHTVNVDLHLTAGPEAAFQPVAWSMTPRQLTEPADAEAVQLDARLAFVGFSRTTRFGRVCLEALRELRSDPGWELRHTRTASIGGVYRLALVVRAPRGAVSRAAVAVGATVREGHALRRFRAELADPVRLAVEQSA